MVLKVHHLRPAPGAKTKKTRKGRGVTVEDLVKKGVARKGYPVKVLGNGDISVKVSVAAHAFSKSATEKISAAGGSAKTL